LLELFRLLRPLSRKSDEQPPAKLPPPR